MIQMHLSLLLFLGVCRRGFMFFSLFWFFLSLVIVYFSIDQTDILMYLISVHNSFLIISYLKRVQFLYQHLNVLLLHELYKLIFVCVKTIRATQYDWMSLMESRRGKLWHVSVVFVFVDSFFFCLLEFNLVTANSVLIGCASGRWLSVCICMLLVGSIHARNPLKVLHATKWITPTTLKWYSAQIMI